MYNVKLYNKISKVGLDDLDPAKYTCSEDFTDYDAVLVRSAKLHDVEFPKNLRCIARACRVSGFMIYGIRLQRFCCSRAFRSSRFRTGWGIPTSPPQPTFTRMCRMWKRYPSPRAQHRLSETDVHSGNVT